MTELIPNLGEAQAFLKTLAPDGVLTFQALDDVVLPNGKKRGNQSLNRVLHGLFEEHAERLVQLNQEQAGIFVMVNKGDGHVQQGNKTCRSAANVIQVRALFVDLDGAPIEPVRNAAVPPDIVVESSPKRYHAYWLAPDCPLHEFTLRQKQLIVMFNGDPAVHDLPRVMRLPGFFHHKAAPFQTRIIGIEK